MVQMTVTVKDRIGFTSNVGTIEKRVLKFLDAEKAARTAAAKRATEVTRQSFTHKREIIAPRPGRSSTGGQIKKYLRWGTGSGQVKFDLAGADTHAPHWIIQEIGTGERATMKQGGKANPTGRPTTGASYLRTVRSQKGRRIKGGLVFASGGRYSPTGSRRNQQLHLASQVTGVPARAPAIRISKEIDGQHFVKKGGQAGFRQYERSLLAAARQSFKKSVRP